MNSSESADNIDYGLNYDEAYFHGLPNYLGEDGFLSDKNFSQTERNGTELTLDAPPRIVNDRTLIPLRAVAEAFGAQVGWDEATQTATVELY